MVARAPQTLAVPPYDLNTFADNLEKRLKGKSAGYQFVVSFRGSPKVSRAGGAARRAPDAQPRAMTVNDKYNIASVSKTITAAAVMKLLNVKGIALITPISKFLPPSFKPAPSTAKITIQQLLTHTSGIRCPKEVTYENLKACVATPVLAADQVYQYNNSNFALFRMIIPRMNGYQTPANANEVAEGSKYATMYMNYVQQNVLTPAGLPVLACKPTDAFPGLCYQHPNNNANGTAFGDMTQTNGSRGWTMSSTQLSTFLRALLYSEKILPAAVAQRMVSMQLGLFTTQVTPTVTATNHGGFYPGAQNPGELHSLIFATSDGVNVALIVNSQLSSGWPVNVVTAAVQETAK
jgi:CubicO group peptidase (beta-lactamase class C family)